MVELFEQFSTLQDDYLFIRKMDQTDADALGEITGNSNIYWYIPPFLYRKSRGNLQAAIQNPGGRDFEKKERIIAGISLRQHPERLVGLAEMFAYKEKARQITIGSDYRSLLAQRNSDRRGEADDGISLPGHGSKDAEGVCHARKRIFGESVEEKRLYSGE